MGAKDMAFSLTPATTGFYKIGVVAEFKPALYVVTDCSRIDTTCLGVADLDCGMSCGQGLMFRLDAGTTYYIIVDGDSAGQDGVYTLFLSYQPIAP
jgi:hypothetical protein